MFYIYLRIKRHYNFIKSKLIILKKHLLNVIYSLVLTFIIYILNKFINVLYNFLMLIFYKSSTKKNFKKCVNEIVNIQLIL